MEFFNTHTGATVVKFPCRFPIKVLGRRSPDFDLLVFELIRGHVPDLRKEALSCRFSRQGKYIAVTVTITAVSRLQLDAIYHDLCAHGGVLMAL
ncbi:MAG: YbeD family protein [Gammaproteobacteria bacterium]